MVAAMPCSCLCEALIYYPQTVAVGAVLYKIMHYLSLRIVVLMLLESTETGTSQR